MYRSAFGGFIVDREGKNKAESEGLQITSRKKVLFSWLRVCVVWVHVCGYPNKMWFHKLKTHAMRQHCVFCRAIQSKTSLLPSSKVKLFVEKSEKAFRTCANHKFKSAFPQTRSKYICTLGPQLWLTGAKKTTKVKSESMFSS